MNVIIIQPPLVQLNSPYPSGAYLQSFFKSLGHESSWYDLSIKLFYSIYSKTGLSKLFSLTETKALQMADKAETSGDENTAFNLRRYVTTQQQWIEWMDFITGILCSGNKNVSGRELTHKFLFSPFAPRGNRMENFLSNIDHNPTADDVRFLCSLALADIADYITAVFDSNFALIRYAESLTVDESCFAQLEKNIDSPVLKEFYEPVLIDFVKNIKISENEKTLFCISSPFAGTFLPALYTGRFIKNYFGNAAFVSIGGGFPNTELRQTSEKELFKYTDAISFDRGYGSYKAWLDLENKGDSSSLYKMRRFFADKISEPKWEDSEIQVFEEKMTENLVPDFTGIDFSIYPRVCDDENPMHRLWSDGTWIKAYMAHGCYWHKCAFCDTQLDYVCGYKPVHVEPLFNGLFETAKKNGVYGIHFVDEALPPALLKDFALLNCKNQNQLYYWGNIRFEKAFTRDLADFLCYGGFGGVSAGLEVATGNGLKNINKGTDLSSIVSACAAFKEAGILVHAYMIYGFWNDTPQSIIDSMETLRQFFEVGLLDSAFWHKFILTKSSQVFSEWEKGEHKDLKPIFNKKTDSIFAKNELHFEGENKFNKFGPCLDNALNAWMHGQNLDMKVTKWFDFQVPNPTIPRDFIEREIEKYEKAKAKSYAQPLILEKLYWLGSKPYVSNKNINWMYLQEEFRAPFTSHRTEICDLLWNLRPGISIENRKIVLDKIAADKDLQNKLMAFRGQGLVCA